MPVHIGRKVLVHVGTKPVNSHTSNLSRNSPITRLLKRIHQNESVPTCVLRHCETAYGCHQYRNTESQKNSPQNYNIDSLNFFALNPDLSSKMVWDRHCQPSTRTNPGMKICHMHKPLLVLLLSLLSSCHTLSLNLLLCTKSEKEVNKVLSS